MESLKTGELLSAMSKLKFTKHDYTDFNTGSEERSIISLGSTYNKGDIKQLFACLIQKWKMDFLSSYKNVEIRGDEKIQELEKVSVAISTLKKKLLEKINDLDASKFRTGMHIQIDNEPGLERTMSGLVSSFADGESFYSHQEDVIKDLNDLVQELLDEREITNNVILVISQITPVYNSTPLKKEAKSLLKLIFDYLNANSLVTSSYDDFENLFFHKNTNEPVEFRNIICLRTIFKLLQKSQLLNVSDRNYFKSFKGGKIYIPGLSEAQIDKKIDSAATNRNKEVKPGYMKDLERLVESHF